MTLGLMRTRMEQEWRTVPLGGAVDEDAAITGGVVDGRRRAIAAAVTKV